MHTCPICDEECDCDMDDTGGLPVPDDCPHVCKEDDFDESDWEADAVETDEDDFEEDPLDEIRKYHD
jgi:hypothetical protein